MDGYDTTAVVINPEGGYGWVVMVASFCSNFITDGILASSGQFMPALIAGLETDAASVTLVGSLLVGFTHLTGPVAAGFANRYGFRPSIIVGALLSAAGFGASYWANSVGYLYGMCGIVGGVGFSLTVVPSALAVNFYFTRWRAVASGTAMMGYNVGGIVLPLVITMCIQAYGWQTAFAFEAVLMVVCAAIGILFRPPPSTAIVQQSYAGSMMSVGYSQGASLTSRTGLSRRNNRNYMSVMELIGEEASMTDVWEQRRPKPRRSCREGCAACVKAFFCCRWRPCCVGWRQCMKATVCCRCLRQESAGIRPMYRDDIFYDASTVRLQQYQSHRRNGDRAYHMTVTRVPTPQDLMEELQHRIVLFPQALRRTLATMCDFSLLASVPLCLQIFSSMIAASTFYTPFIFLPARGLSEGLEPLDATLFVITISVGAAFGRVCCTVLASLPCTNHFIVQSTAFTLGGVVVIASGFDLGYNAQLACCALYGLYIAFCSNLRCLILVDLVGLQDLTNAYGLLLMFQGVGYIAGPPTAGAIFEATGNNYSTLFWIAGGVLLFAGVLTYPLNELQKRGEEHDIVRR